MTSRWFCSASCSLHAPTDDAPPTPPPSLHSGALPPTQRASSLHGPRQAAASAARRPAPTASRSSWPACWMPSITSLNIPVPGLARAGRVYRVNPSGMGSCWPPSRGPEDLNWGQVSTLCSIQTQVLRPVLRFSRSATSQHWLCCQ